MTQNPLSTESDVIGAEIDIKILAGRNLVAKDGSGFLGLGKNKSSDPYVVISYSRKQLGKTKVIKKTLNPTWDETFKFMLEGRSFRPAEDVVLDVFDHDKSSADDPMGQVRLTFRQLASGQVIDNWFPVQPTQGCKDATGDLHVRVSVALRRALSLNARSCVRLTDRHIAVGLGWDPLPGNRAIDLDTSCVCMSARGEVLMDETVYFAKLSNTNGAIRHTGDEREGDEDLGQGDDEIIIVDLAALPHRIQAIFFIATVASENCSFADVKSARMRLVEWNSGKELCRYMPAMSGAHTALFMCRIARDGASWVLSMIGEFDHTARDFGTLIPEMKMYMSDLVPGITVSHHDRIAVMRKGGNIRLRDYCAPSNSPDYPDITLGLFWDVTNGVNIDLDASIIMLDMNLRQIDLVFFGKLRSSDGSIQHGGDEREGDEKGDDEKIFIKLGRVHPAVAYIGIVINSYSGQELDDVKDAGCHLFDTSSLRDIAKFEMSNSSFLDKHTALLVGMLFREPQTLEWCLRIISEAAHGRTAHENVDELQNHIKREPPRPLNPPRPPPGAGNAMLSQSRSQLPLVGTQYMPTLSAATTGGAVVMGTPIA